MGERHIMVVKTDEGGWEIVIERGNGERYTVATIHNLPEIPGFTLPTGDELAVVAGFVSGEIMRLNPEVSFRIDD